MRRTTVLSSLAVTAVLTFGSAPAAQALPASGIDSAAAGRSQAALTCYTGVVGVDGDKRVYSLSLKNAQVTDTARSRTKLSFRPTAWGFFDSQATKAGSVLRVNTMTSDGKPRRVTMSFKDGSKKFGLDSSAYDQKGFKASLFADGFTYYAYTVTGSGNLQRWALTRYRNGDIRYAQKVTIGSGYGDLTSLQASQVFKSKGANREYLYATTDTGALEQIAVPLKKPQKAKRRTLLSTGYAGVTELAWSFCNDDPTYTSLVAIDPAAGTATWTTIKDSVTNPTTTLRGAVSGGGDWDLSAAY